MKYSFKQLINRSYQAIVNRGLITKTTQKAQFIIKLKEELQEVVDAYILEDKTEDDYAEELTDLATVCIMQLTHLGYDFEEEFKKCVEKNERRAKERH